MSRLDAAVAELVEALREELRVEAAAPRPDRLLDIESTAETLGVTKATLYKELGSGRLRSIKVGRRRLIPSSALEAYIAERAA
jgi:excisionase family DNA binding protein